MKVLLAEWDAGTGDWNVGGSWDSGVPGASDTASIVNGGTLQRTGAAPAISYFYIGNGTGTGGTMQVTGGGTPTANGGQSYLGINSGSTGTLNVGNGGAAGIVNATATQGGSGIATVDFNHTDTDYVLSSDGTGTAVNISGSAAVNQMSTGTLKVTDLSESLTVPANQTD